jgi:TonB family protein
LKFFIRYFIIVLSLSSFEVVCAQNRLNNPLIVKHITSFDTVQYFNSNWKLTSKDSCAFYKIIKQNDAKYIIEYYKNSGVITERGEYSSINPEVKSGHFVTFFADGTISSEFETLDNKINGEFKEFHPNGKLSKKMFYEDNNRKGNPIEFSENGDVVSSKQVENQDVEESDTLDLRTDEIPKFPGGEKALRKFLEKNIYYPLNADEVEGIVIVSVIIEVDGSVSDIKILKSAHPEFSAEAIRVMKLMPNWIPGKKEGEEVRVIIEIPILFSIHDLD